MAKGLPALSICERHMTGHENEPWSREILPEVPDELLTHSMVFSKTLSLWFPIYNGDNSVCPDTSQQRSPWMTCSQGHSHPSGDVINSILDLDTKNDLRVHPWWALPIRVYPLPLSATCWEQVFTVWPQSHVQLLEDMLNHSRMTKPGEESLEMYKHPHSPWWLSVSHGVLI